MYTVWIEIYGKHRFSFAWCEQRQLHEEPETGKIITTRKVATVVKRINSYKRFREPSRVPVKQLTVSMKKKSRKSGLLQASNFQFVQSSKIQKNLSPSLSVY